MSSQPNSIVHADGLPATTREKLTAFRSQVRRIKIAEGLLAGIFGLIVSWLVVFVFDRIIDTPWLLRLAILIVGSVGLAILFPWKCHHWIWGTRSFEQVAMLLRRKYPAFGDQLLGVVELARQQSQGTSSALVQAAISYVDSLVARNSFHDAVPTPRHRRWAIAAGIPGLLAVLVLLLVPSAGRNALARWLMPWKPVERFTFTQLQDVPAELIVPRGEAYPLQTKLAPTSEWNPETATLNIGQRVPLETQRESDAYAFEIPAQSDAVDARLSAGDFRSVVRVIPKQRPELTSLEANVQLPAYLQAQAPRRIDARSGVLTVVKGSAAEFTAGVSRELSAAIVDGQSVPVNGTTMQVASRQFRDPAVLNLSWTDSLGLEPSRPFQLKVNVVDDVSPTVSCLQQDPTLVVMTTDVISFDISADDDFGLRQVGLEWKGIPDPLTNPNPQDGEKLVAGGIAEQGRLKVVGTFCADSDKMQPQGIQLRAWAEDFNPDGQRSYSPSIQLFVMTPADHAVWISEQLRRWASRADDIYEEELRLHETNRQIRGLTAEERATPEMQASIGQQVEGEQANAARLSAITMQGKGLIDQAMRNQEMQADHVELWAQSLHQLEAISGNRMPTVASLLKTGAQQALKAANSAPAKAEDAAPADAKTGPEVGNNRNPTAGEAGGDEQKKPEEAAPAIPKLTDVESGFLKNEDPESEDKDKEGKGKSEDKEPKSSGGGGLSLPSTQLMGGPKNPKTESGEEELPEKDAVEMAIEEQEKLLMEFEKVREDLQKIMDDLENSTFVKRLKAASRRQLEIAGDLNRTLFNGFGIPKDRLDIQLAEQSAAIAVREEEQSKFVWAIQTDLEAYIARNSDEQYARVLEDMKKTNVIEKIAEIGARVRGNLSGESISRAEFWADTLDRWGEEVVVPAKPGSDDKEKGSQGGSLPPAIVLEIMRILEGEIGLREETRSLEQARSVLEEKDVLDKASVQSATQVALRIRTQQVIMDVEALPESEEKFARELLLLGQASYVMQEAERLLLIGLTGPQTIGAETEVIELLLQSKRSNPKGGGGQGGTAPGKGGEGSTEEAALALLGPGSDPNAHIDHRGVQQSTGETGEALPEEFRDGLDAFFDAVESSGRTDR
ncbi:MAG: hypothetical protein JNL58_18965 [Planctomyces sp.]|nr:hypothetical protein [Planctomyces sp.]